MQPVAASSTRAMGQRSARGPRTEKQLTESLSKVARYGISTGLLFESGRREPVTLLFTFLVSGVARESRPWQFFPGIDLFCLSYEMIGGFQ